MAAAPVNTAPAQSPSQSENVPHINGASSSSSSPSESIDFPHYKELQRNLRNAVKKLNATAKVDSIIAENPGKSLDDLVAEKKINNDQKAQALKKPSLQASVTQIEEQIAHYKEFAAYYEQRLVSQKAELEKAHKEEVESLQEKASVAASETGKDELNQRLLSLSKFLCAAANMRRSGDETSSESRAFEGVLYQVYGGSLEAVASILKLVDGVEEKIVSVEGETLDVTYAKVKQISGEQASTSEEPVAEAAPMSDPTTANAAYTELQDPSYAAEAAAATEHAAAATQPEQLVPPPQTLVPDAANAVAEASWESNPADSLASSHTESWVEVPRDPAETETGLQATPANVDPDVKIDAGERKTPRGDGFEQVVHHQRQPSFRGRGRGRGRGGDGFRGRGRGDFRGRGRGRGGRGRGGPNGGPAAAGPAPAAAQ
ncbi:hypothetical protein P175DRAFT_0516513 [Aspergillus ochraceoroseus IBT 24754]|uniref:YAG7-like dimerisation domain-containing protein n=2 Tax=Aspergillus ochraceoroseus TaxID=138278 RepID=A0A2T5LXD2_9EURO|nr:uncharacterized protein P175DRAFT_0516513 [Aspergillus ochraceoroseus IBT 24754]KKK15508.1 hypothetical protein AOCH_004441 [Aspergillus ochraceoroseus]PTU20893.1 hypothetical protein P175DRAFT_0516513 [Aspergillus ochraceoroseus IBT 24754]